MSKLKYWDELYPTHIIIPKNYWVYSYTLSENNND